MPCGTLRGRTEILFRGGAEAGSFGENVTGPLAGARGDVSRCPAAPAEVSDE